MDPSWVSYEPTSELLQKHKTLFHGGSSAPEEKGRDFSQDRHRQANLEASFSKISKPVALSSIWHAFLTLTLKVRHFLFTSAACVAWSIALGFFSPRLRGQVVIIWVILHLRTPLPGALQDRSSKHDCSRNLAPRNSWLNWREVGIYFPT